VVYNLFLDDIQKFIVLGWILRFIIVIAVRENASEKQSFMLFWNVQEVFVILNHLHDRAADRFLFLHDQKNQLNIFNARKFFEKKGEVLLISSFSFGVIEALGIDKDGLLRFTPH